MTKLPPRTLITDEEAAQILRPYGLRLRRLRPLFRGTINSNYHVETDSGPAFLRVCEGKTEADLRFEARLIWHLTSHGLCTPPLWYAHNRDPFVKLAREGSLPQRAMLFEWIDGVECLDSEVDGARAHAVGQLLGQLHLCAASLQAEHAPGLLHGAPAHRESIYTLPLIRKRLVAMQLAPRVRARLGAVLDELMAEATRLLSTRGRGLPSGLGHNDLFPDNLLFPRRRRRSKRAPMGVSEGWVLDLEQAASTPYVYDVAVSLLSFCAPAPQWPPLESEPGSSPDGAALTEPQTAASPSAGAPAASVDTAARLGPLRREQARALLDGYQSMRVLSEAEWGALHAELRVAAVRFTTTRLTDIHLRAVAASSGSAEAAGSVGSGEDPDGVLDKDTATAAPAHSKDYRDFLWRLRRLKEVSADELLAELR